MGTTFHRGTRKLKVRAAVVCTHTWYEPLLDGNTFTDVLMKASNSSRQGEEMLAEHLKVCDSHMNSCKYVLVSAEGSGRYAKVKEVFVFGAEPSGGPCSGRYRGITVNSCVVGCQRHLA